MSAQEKPQLGWDELKGMAKVAQQINLLPDGPEKEAMKGRFEDAHNQILEKYDMPIREISPHQTMLGIGLKAADYGSGLARTAINEPLLAAKAGVNAVRGAPDNYRAADAKTRVLHALNPFDRPALSNKEYMDLAGIGDMGKLADSEGRFPVTGKEALGFGLDTIENPAMILGGLKALMGRGAQNAARSEITAEAMREAERAAKERAARAPSPGLMENLQPLPGQAAGWVADPLSQLRDALLKMRFRNADKAVELSSGGGKIVGRPLPSKIFQESGAKGVTSEGIRQDARAIVNANSDKIDQMTNDVATINRDGIYRGVPSEIAANPEVHARTAMHPLYTPEQQLFERTPFTAKDAQAARAQIEDEFRAASAGNPALMNEVGRQVERRGAPETASAGTDQLKLFATPPKPVTRTSPEQTLMTDDGFIRASRPAKSVTTYDGGTRAVAPPVSSDPLSVDEPFSLPQISQMASAAQGKAATRKFYLSRDRFSPDSPQTPPASREAIAAEGGLYASQGQHLRGLQEDIMDETRPGLGGEVHGINQKSSSLLEGIPYIDRAKPTPSAGTPTSRSRSAFGGVPMMALDAGSGAAKTAGMAGYQALSNPWIRQGALPAARAEMLRRYWNMNDTPTFDAEGNPGGENPWGLIYKYGAQR